MTHRPCLGLTSRLATRPGWPHHVSRLRAGRGNTPANITDLVQLVWRPPGDVGPTRMMPELQRPWILHGDRASVVIRGQIGHRRAIEAFERGSGHQVYRDDR